MDRYTICCSEEQTKRAYKLGAPIDECSYSINPHLTLGVGRCLIYPTAEQMIGWLRSKELYIHVCREDGGLFSYCVLAEKSQGTYDIEKDIHYLNTYEEATLAAIDAALEYLEKKGGKE